MNIPLNTWILLGYDIHHRSWTARTWTMIVGKQSFPLGKLTVQGAVLNFWGVLSNKKGTYILSQSSSDKELFKNLNIALEVNCHFKMDDDKPLLEKRRFVNQPLRKGGWTSRVQYINLHPPSTSIFFPRHINVKALKESNPLMGSSLPALNF